MNDNGHADAVYAGKCYNHWTITVVRCKDFGTIL